MRLTRYGGADGITPSLLLSKLERTCDSCPAQWEGTQAPDGSRFYARARHGRFRAELAGQVIVDLDLRDPSIIGLLSYPLDGDEPTTAEMLRIVGADLVSPPPPDLP